MIGSLLLMFFTALVGQAGAQDIAYGAYSLSPVGSPRVLGMGGAFAGLADDSLAVLTNPAGLALSKWSLDIGGATNRVVDREYDSDGDDIKDTFPYTSVSNTAAARIGPVGFGIAYSKPFDMTADLGGFDYRKRSIIITDYDAAVALSIFKGLAIGASAKVSKVDMGYKNALTGDNVKAEANKTFPVVGILLHADRKVALGISWTPERRYNIDETKDAELTSGEEWFHDVVIPEKLTFGAALRATNKLSWTGDFDIYRPVKNAVLIGDGVVITADRQILNKEQTILHGGFEYIVLNEKKLAFIWRGGGYQSPKRTLTGADRFHFTMGVEARFGALVFAAAYDQAKDFSNVAQSVSVSLGAL